LTAVPSLWQVPRIRRASTSSSTLEQQPPKKTSRRDYSDFAFVTFFALGDQGDSGHKCATLHLLFCSYRLLNSTSLGRWLAARSVRR